MSCQDEEVWVPVNARDRKVNKQVECKFCEEPVWSNAFKKHFSVCLKAAECDVCGHRCSHSEIGQHKRDEHPSMIDCKHCNESLDVRDLSNHLENCSVLIERHQNALEECAICHEKVKICDMNDHHEKIHILQQCGICHLVMPASDCDSHFLSHRNFNPAVQHPHTNVTTTFHTISEALDHIYDKIPLLRECNHCHQQIPASELQNHINEAHATIECTICGEQVDRHSMTTHLKEMHPGKHCYNCNMFIFEKDWKKHIRGGCTAMKGKKKCHK